MSPNTILWLITGCLMLQPLSTDLYLPSLPHLATYFAVTPAVVQQTLSLFVFGFATAQLVSGPLSDRFGRRPVLFGGLLTYLAASIACGLAPSIALLVLGRFVQAIGCCTAVVVARAIIRDAFEPAEGARMIAKASSIFSLAPILGPILGGYLQIVFGWRAAFAAQTFFCGLLAVAAWRLLSETNQHKNPQATRFGSLSRGYFNIARNPTFWAYTLPGALSYGSIFAFISGSSFVLIRVLGVATEIYGYCFAFGVVGYLVGTILCRYLLGRIGLTRSFTLGSRMSLGAGLLFLLLVNIGLHHWTVVVGCLFLTMLAHGVNFPCLQAGAIAPFPKQAGAAAGLMGSCMMIAALLVGIWVGASHDGTLYPLATISAAIGIALFASARALQRYRS
ncbi:MAG: multidrug effflux MFS transporter [Betaproteobacteria bacterium]|nr:multidrug effflux MFS transporter [Betaproteobacteria bacterium]